MPNTANFPGGATGSPGAFAYVGDPPVSSNSFALPTGNLAANGKRPVKVYRAYGYIGGAGGSATCTIAVGSGQSAGFSVGADSSPESTTGWRDINQLFSNGGNVDITYTASGNDIYVWRSASAGSMQQSTGYTWAGAMAGKFEWATVPTKNAITSATPGTDPDTSAIQVTLRWATPSSNGGSPVTGYRVQYSTSSTFASGVTTLNPGLTTGTIISGLTASTVYYFRVAALNDVTSDAGTTAAWSSAAKVTTTSASGGGGSGGSSENLSGQFRLYIWNGQNLVEVS